MAESHDKSPTVRRGGTKRPTKAKTATPRESARRADFGAPIDSFFAKQPAHLSAILEELRRMVLDAAPDAEASLKWGMPWFSRNGAMMCALGGHKAHVNLILMGEPSAFDDPEGMLSGTGANGRHLKITTLDGLPRAAIRKWLRAAARLAKKQ